MPLRMQYSQLSMLPIKIRSHSEIEMTKFVGLGIAGTPASWEKGTGGPALSYHVVPNLGKSQLVLATYKLPCSPRQSFSCMPSKLFVGAFHCSL